MPNKRKNSTGKKDKRQLQTNESNKKRESLTNESYIKPLLLFKR